MGSVPLMHAAERRLRRLRLEIEWLTTNLPKAIGSLTVQTPDGYPTSSEGRGSGHANPTESAALHGAKKRDAYLHLDLLTVDLLRQVGLLVKAVEAVQDIGVDTELEWSRHRCDGGEGVWADPLCTSLAVRTEDVGSGRRMALCWACRKRFQRHRWSESEATG